MVKRGKIIESTHPPQWQAVHSFIRPFVCFLIRSLSLVLTLCLQKRFGEVKGLGDDASSGSGERTREHTDGGMRCLALTLRGHCARHVGLCRKSEEEKDEEAE